ncbi:MAG: DEAD/DEAH box helicase, partial [Planctomycetes bacterium]|nr:DEAD/DEAH box helicase [Planctomycetota bacterium]
MRELRDRYRDDHRVQALAAAQAADRELVLGAVHGGLMPLLLAAWSQRPGRPRLVVCGDPAGTAEDLEELGVAVAVLPELDLISQGEMGAETDGADHAGHARRMAALEAYSAGHLLLATPAAAEQPVPSLADVAATGIVLRKGQEHDLHQLVDRLVDAGYRVVAAVEGRGELAVRGGIVDVFPWIGADPCRIEFFGDQVEAIRRFDVFTQESIAQADEAVLASAKRGHATRSLWEQLPPGPLCVLGDLPLRGRLKRDHGRREIRLARQLEGGAEDGASLGVERLRGDLRRGLSGLKALLAETGAGGAVLLARSDEAAKELGKHAADAGIPARVTVGRLHAGFRDLDGGLVAVHDFELAEREPVRKRSARVAGGSPLSSLNDLRHGDHVVHLRHGVGVFRGMATLEKRGFLEDFLLLEFAEGTRLYVPVDAIDLVQKWVGAGGRAPALDRIGGGAWAKRKAKAEKAIEDMSAELLAAQARRLAAGGIASAADTPELRRFEAEFPFEETEDQLSAVREIKTDMERAVAMDRLLCGDVGFGKTEVAMRAAFKAVQSGLQVAVMAPTTLLAEQHLESFSERLGPFGAKVAGMTRFRSAKEKAAVLVKAAEGAVDVLVGTHALLSDKLRFARLGLLVIDEEHRFGVKHKEKLKELRHAGQIPCDVLTLSATPIPRTLHFSMLGIRDISVLAEAPAARLAVETRVAPWDDQMVQHAIERELAREGQLFAVHNRIAELDNLVRRLVHLSPKLRIDVIHGQMEEERIVAVMEAFRHRRLDCLVATSIVESGIDIPNANTLFVA